MVTQMLNGVRYRVDERNGSRFWYRDDMWQTLVKITNVLCEDGKRRTVTITGEADSFWTVPGKVHAYGKTVRGHVYYDDQKETETFAAWRWLKNWGLLNPREAGIIKEPDQADLDYAAAVVRKVQETHSLYEKVPATWESRIKAVRAALYGAGYAIWFAGLIDPLPEGAVWQGEDEDGNVTWTRHMAEAEHAEFYRRTYG